MKPVVQPAHLGEVGDRGLGRVFRGPVVAQGVANANRHFVVAVPHERLVPPADKVDHHGVAGT